MDKFTSESSLTQNIIKLYSLTCKNIPIFYVLWIKEIWIEKL